MLSAETVVESLYVAGCSLTLDVNYGWIIIHCVIAVEPLIFMYFYHSRAKKKKNQKRVK